MLCRRKGWSALIDPIVWVCLGVFVVLLLIEVPIPFGMMASSLLYILYQRDSFVMFASKLSTSFSDFTMMAVPAFLFVGIFMNEVGLTDRLFTGVEAWIGHLTGGLAHANVLASMIFAGMSGSALADAGGLGTIEVKTMREAGYQDEFTVAVTAASSVIGPIIPPSINFVMWAFLSGSSTMAMFMAGIVPGVLCGAMLMVWIYVSIKFLGVKAPKSKKYTWSERMRATWRALPAVAGPAVLIAGIMTGAFTPTECGVVASAFCILVAVCVRRFSVKMLLKALRSSISSAAMVMALCGTGLIFNWMITTSGLVKVLVAALLSLGSNALIVILLNVLMLFLGCFLGASQILILLAPLLISIGKGIGMSMVQMGVMAVFNLTISLMTPPVAPSLFITAKAAGVPFNKCLKYGCQFLVPLVVTQLLIMFIPAVTEWFPRLMGVM